MLANISFCAFMTKITWTFTYTQGKPKSSKNHLLNAKQLRFILAVFDVS